MGPYPFVGPWPIPRWTDVFFCETVFGVSGWSGNFKKKNHEHSIYTTWKWMVGRLASFWKGLFSGAMIFFGMVIKTIVLPKVSNTTPFENENHVESFAFLPSCLFPRPLRSNASYLALWMLTCNLLPGQLSWRHPKNWFMICFFQDHVSQTRRLVKNNFPNFIQQFFVGRIFLHAAFLTTKNHMGFFTVNLVPAKFN